MQDLKLMIYVACTCDEMRWMGLIEHTDKENNEIW